MSKSARIFGALRISGFHFLASIGVAAIVAIFVFGLWYPYPFRELSGGREIFWILVSVDVICGPLLTLVLFNPKKPKKELFFDLSCVGVVQLLALAFGLYTLWVAKPLYLVHEVDRFKVITASDIDVAELKNLPGDMQPKLFSGPTVVGTREPRSAEERSKVLFESLQGGRDFGERPEFYEKYEGAVKERAMLRARRLDALMSADEIEKSFRSHDIKELYYLPVVARQDWIAVLDGNGSILGFLKGNGF
jgi:hypothetical protein